MASSAQYGPVLENEERGRTSRIEAFPAGVALATALGDDCRSGLLLVDGHAARGFVVDAVLPGIREVVTAVRADSPSDVSSGELARGQALPPFDGKVLHAPVDGGFTARLVSAYYSGVDMAPPNVTSGVPSDSRPVAWDDEVSSERELRGVHRNGPSSGRSAGCRCVRVGHAAALAVYDVLGDHQARRVPVNGARPTNAVLVMDTETMVRFWGRVAFR